MANIDINNLKDNGGSAPSTQVVGKGIATTDTSRFRPYTYYSIMQFPSWSALKDFAKKIPKNNNAESGNKEFEKYINSNLSALNRDKNAAKFSAYGIDGKHPKSYAEAMARDTFVYMDQYKRVKEKVDKLIRDWMLRSEAETEKPKLVYNDKAIGEFVFSKAAMSLAPKLFYYSPSKNIEVDAADVENISPKEMVLKSDKSKVVFAFKVKKKSKKVGDIPPNLGSLSSKTKKIDGEIYNLMVNDLFSIDDSARVNAETELINMGYQAVSIGNQLWVRKPKEDKDTSEYVYVEAKDDQSLRQATKLGLLQVKSENKKVYLFKEKKPKIFNTVKLIIALKAGGFTSWKNDLYTGVTAMVLTETLESLGYCVGIEIVVGGGRCDWCGMDLNTPDGNGRRYFSFTAKGFNEQLDQNGLLYTVADPSFHNIKWISYINYFFGMFGDDISAQGDPTSNWHGIEKEDMINPLGLYHKAYDYSKGNKNLLHFYIHQIGATDSGGFQVSDENENIQKCVESVRSIIEDTLNENKKALEKLKTSGYDFGFNK
jgi:hypothetical protein